MRRAHRGLQVWRESMALVEDVYAVTTNFPVAEQYGLTIQMRRAAVSIPSNIAEGAARINRKEFLQFVSIASGSLSELDTHVEIAVRLGYIKDSDALQRRIDYLFALLVGLTKSLRNEVARK
jgi:four helix bundle protein